MNTIEQVSDRLFRLVVNEGCVGCTPELAEKLRAAIHPSVHAHVGVVQAAYAIFEDAALQSAAVRDLGARLAEVAGLNDLGGLRTDNRGHGMAAKLREDPAVAALKDVEPAFVDDRPVRVSRAQMLLALDAVQTGTATAPKSMLNDIEAFVATQSRGVQIEWSERTEFHRDNALLNQMATAFGLTAAQVDGLFADALTR